jgi:DNA modification methylase
MTLLSKPYNLYTGDNLLIMRERIESESHDSSVLDGPYGIRFMGKAWDAFDIEKTHSKRNSQAHNEKVRPGRKTNGFGASIFAGQYDLRREANVRFQEWFTLRAMEIFRILKPGGYALSFGSPRTFHRMVCAFEDAGFEIRDTIQWVFASGFPKSKDLTDHGFDGWGTALKPAYEPILVARKPITESNIESNMRKHGTGGINIDGCRIPYAGPEDFDAVKYGNQPKLNGGRYQPGQLTPTERHAENITGNPKGRWPSNFIHDGSEEVVNLFPYTKSGSGNFTKETATGYQGNAYGQHHREAGSVNISYGDSGSAARFFYCAKISPEDRNEGLEALGLVNDHPTVKPTELMRYLVKMVTPIGGRCLDPFAGSGSTGKGCMYELINFTGIDEEPKWLPIQEGRMRFALKMRSGQIPLI